MATKKREITAQEKAICARLKDLWDQRAAALGLTQENAAVALGISQGGVSHYLNGRNAIGFEAMFRWAQMLRVHPYDIDPDFRDRLPADLRTAVDSMHIAAPASMASAHRESRRGAFHVHERSK